jgi:hypothetical protein
MIRTLCLLALIGTAARAEISVKQYLTVAPSRDQSLIEMTTAYINGMGAGFTWANGRLNARGMPKLFCTPRSLSLNANNYIDILDKQISRMSQKETPGLDDLPIGFVLLLGLEETFPCK